MTTWQIVRIVLTLMLLLYVTGVLVAYNRKHLEFLQSCGWKRVPLMVAALAWPILVMGMLGALIEDICEWILSRIYRRWER